MNRRTLLDRHHHAAILVAAWVGTAIVACSSGTMTGGGTTTTTGGATTTATTSSTTATTTTGTGGTTTTTTTTSSTTNTTPCAMDLSDIGTGDFEIDFTLQTTQTDAAIALLNQRSACNTSDFWDISISSGHLALETNSFTDGSSLDATTVGCIEINDGKVHQVVVQRVSGLLKSYVDGEGNNIAIASQASWGTLQALAQGTSPCVGVGGMVAFDTTKGSITNVCINTSAQAQADAGTCQ